MGVRKNSRQPFLIFRLCPFVKIYCVLYNNIPGYASQPYNVLKTRMFFFPSPYILSTSSYANFFCVPYARSYNSIF